MWMLTLFTISLYKCVYLVFILFLSKGSTLLFTITESYYQPTVGVHIYYVLIPVFRDAGSRWCRFRYHYSSILLIVSL